MRAKSASRNVEHRAERALQTWSRLEWRKQRYGFYCLTAQEYRAAWYSAHYKMTMRGGKDEKSLQGYVANQMRISQSWVSRLLRNVNDIAEYFDLHNIPFQWREGRVGWELDTPVSVMPWGLPAIQLPRYMQDARAA